jgi:hypothetical protein
MADYQRTEKQKADKRWNQYDSVIQEAVETANRKFAGIQHYKNLDWLIVKAMIWTEVLAGPGTREWETRPMQIGKYKDPGWNTLADLPQYTRKNDREKAKLIIPAELVKEMRIKGKYNPAVNIRAGVFWLCYNAAAISDDKVSIDDGHIPLSYEIGSNRKFGRLQVPNTLAGPLKTTQEVIMKDTQEHCHCVIDPKKLHTGDVLYYHNAHLVWTIVGWKDWEEAVAAYNGQGDDNYMDKFHERLLEVREADHDTKKNGGRK